jgi:hypothetical protein
MKNFIINSFSNTKLKNWKIEQDVIARKSYHSYLSENDFHEYSYLGSAYVNSNFEGGITFSIVPSINGSLIKVRHNTTKNEISLNDYDPFEI